MGDPSASDQSGQTSLPRSATTGVGVAGGKPFGMNIRCMGKNNKIEVDSEAAFSGLQTRIEDMTQIPPNRQILKCGFPPRPMDLKVARGCSIAGAGLTNREMIHVDAADSDQDLGSASYSGGADHRDVILKKTESAPAPGSAGVPSSAAAAAVPTSSASTVAPSSMASAAPQSMASAAPTAPKENENPKKEGGNKNVFHTPVVARDGGAYTESLIERHVVPADNSCLFEAILFNLRVGNETPKIPNLTARALRNLVARTIRNDASTYDPLTLCDGKTSLEYADWISRDESWGGFLELNILSQYFRVQICAVDIISQRIEKFPHEFPGQGSSGGASSSADSNANLDASPDAKRAKKDDNSVDTSAWNSRMVVFYDGIHYDAAKKTLKSQFWAQNTNQMLGGRGQNDGGAGHSGIYPATPDKVANHTAVNGILDEAMVVAMDLHSRKQFTDTGNFTLQCGVCFAGLKGQAEAQAHAKATGHINFQEYNPALMKK